MTAEQIARKELDRRLHDLIFRSMERDVERGPTPRHGRMARKFADGIERGEYK